MPEPTAAVEYPPLTLERLRSLQDIQLEKVIVPEWGATVWVKSMTANESDQLEDSMVKSRSAKAKPGKPVQSMIRARIVVACACDENGRKLFTSADLDWIGTKNAAGIDRIVTVANRLSGRGPRDAEELLGNSESDPEDDAPSGSHKPLE